MQTIAWGGDPLYVGMKRTNPARIKSQCADYGSMIHNEYMLQKQGGVGLDSAKQTLVNKYKEEGTNKVVLRGLLKDLWLHSLRKFLYFILSSHLQISYH